MKRCASLGLHRPYASFRENELRLLIRSAIRLYIAHVALPDAGVVLPRGSNSRDTSDHEKSSVIVGGYQRSESAYFGSGGDVPDVGSVSDRAIECV